MSIRIASLISALILFSGISALATDIDGLFDCTVKVFREINKTDKWSGKAPKGCSSKVKVNKRPDGVFVTAWKDDKENGVRVRTAFSTAMGYSELATAKELEKAIKAINKRAEKLERCMDSNPSANLPLECRTKVGREYLVGDETGIEKTQTYWLDDDGRHTVIEIMVGSIESTPAPPADIPSSQALPVGTKLNIILR